MENTKEILDDSRGVISLQINGQNVKELRRVRDNAVVWSGGDGGSNIIMLENITKLAFSNETAKYMVNMGSYFEIYDVDKKQKIIKFDVSSFPNYIVVNKIKFVEYLESKNRLIIADDDNIFLIDCSTGKTIVKKSLPKRQDGDIRYFYDKKGNFICWIVNPPNNNAYAEFLNEDNFSTLRYINSYRQVGTGAFTYIGDSRVIYDRSFIYPENKSAPFNYNVMGFDYKSYIYHADAVYKTFSVYDYTSLSKVAEMKPIDLFDPKESWCSSSGIVANGYYGRKFEFFWFDRQAKAYTNTSIEKFLIGDKLIMRVGNAIIIGKPKNLSMSKILIGG